MKKVLIAILLLFLFIMSYDHLKTIYTYDILDQGSFDNNTLIIFDIDKVIFTETDPYERGYRVERKRANTVASLFAKDSMIAQSLDPETRKALWAIYARDLDESLIDASLPLKIRLLQEKGVKVMALTRFMAGKAGDHSAVEKIRIDKLRSEGIDFGQSFPDYDVIQFPQFTNDSGQSAVFRDGVLFTTFACAKGELLVAFLNAINWYPERVIMFDDKRDNLISVQQALRPINILFTGYLYKGASQLPEHFDKEGAQLQMHYLLNQHIWLSLDAIKKQSQSKLYLQDAV